MGKSGIPGLQATGIYLKVLSLHHKDLITHVFAVVSLSLPANYLFQNY